MEKEKFLGVTLATSKQKEVPIVFSEKWEHEPVLDQTFVTFSVNGLKVLGKISDIKTLNPFMDPQNIGSKNLVYLKTKGDIPNLSESTDAKIGVIEVIGCKENENEDIKNLFNSPPTGIKVYASSDEDFEFFFKHMFKGIEPVRCVTIRGSNYILPMDPKKFFLHTDIIADTGRGKTHLAMLLTTQLHGKKIALFDKDRKETPRNISIWVIDRDGQFANDALGIFKKLKRDDPRFVVRYEEMRVESQKELVALLERVYDFDHMPFKAIIADVNYWLSLNLREPWTYEGFVEALSEAIRRAYRDRRRADRTVEDTRAALDLKNGERLWEREIVKKLRAPYTINDLVTKSQQGKMIVIDLENAEEYQKPIITDYILRKLFNIARFEYGRDMIEYGFSTIVFIDEVQDYCPQETPQWYNKDSKEIIEKIAKQGRKYGLSLIVASQRYASVSKDTLTQMNNHFISKVKFGDLQRVKDEHGASIVDALKNLGPYEFIVKGEICPTEFAIVKGVSK